MDEIKQTSKQDSKLKTFTVRLPWPLLQKLKLHCVKRQTSVQAVAAIAIQNHLAGKQEAA